MGDLFGPVTANVALKIRSELDYGASKTGRNVTPERMNTLHVERDKFDGEPNHTLAIRRTILLPSVPSVRMAVM